MKYNNAVLLLASATIVIVFSGEVFGMPPAQCSPGFLDEIPPRIRKVCAALSTLYELGTAMENYIEDKVSVLHETVPLPDSGVKRQDVDHVFLRFGKRR
ncbi:myosuppressin isoform X1 [Leptopilina heterotoma]|uniref:myosuppressin isoform X1 n=1 Tax=Leptopilina heterotoma TaxID=63436 RepID=UPI001CA8C8A0|nr:myosuppressin isoform X1 [Leptopilina heterotoma]XP_043482846.1 myosuppressin isoform X1 [Leptopilina heterotoma]XP_043482847.1 myosuppressin isoform X1 [Leptopilina heterotoma]